jgi:hypothetical protein
MDDRMTRSRNRGCHANTGLISRDFLETADLNDPTM